MKDADDEYPRKDGNGYAVGTLLRRAAVELDAVSTRSGVGLGHWERRDGRHVAYTRPDHHTLSLYLADGRRTRAVEPGLRTGPSGSPGSISVMPAGSETLWDNRGYVRWTHVYFREEHLAQATDGRMLDLPATTFSCDPATRTMVEGFLLCLDWHAPADALALDHGVHAMLARVALRGTIRAEPLRGGLTPRQMRIVEEIVHERLDERIEVADLAAAVGLSVRQFSRAFHATNTMPPYAWVLRKRCDRAGAMLAQGTPPAQVATACGFSSQSHMVRRMREVRR